MFAKVFGQIFDSSIAEDYNCRRMFMDLLVLADSDGVVDMTHEAIARRTNVPIEEVIKYVKELGEPDETSRSKACEGRRIVPLDFPNRDWGWKIVNYHHYRRIRDEAARREYFREAQRKQRARKKKEGKDGVKDTVLTTVDTSGQVLTPPSASSSPSVHPSVQEVRQYCTMLNLPESDGEAMHLHWQEKKWPKNWKLTIQKWKAFGYLPSQKQKRNLDKSGQSRPSRQSEAERWYAKKTRETD